MVNLYPYGSLAWCKKLLRNYLIFLSYGTLHLFWAQKCNIWFQYQKIRNSSKWPLWSVISFSEPLTSCKKSKKFIINFLSYGAPRLLWDQKCIIWDQGNTKLSLTYYFKKLERYQLNFLSYGTPHLFRTQNWGIWVQYHKKKKIQ